jgi:hypothetical protein
MNSKMIKGSAILALFCVDYGSAVTINSHQRQEGIFSAMIE